MHFPGVTLVTGAGSGIGRATAKLYARDGCARIAIADLNKDNVEETKLQIQADYPKTDVLVIQVDITSEESVDRMISTVVERFGRVDYVCNAAGILIPGPTDEVSVALFDKQLEVNLKGTWLCQRAEIKQMLKQDPIQADDAHVASRGSIANIASMCAMMAYDHLPAYCASKHGILGLCRTDGLRYAKQGIRVNAICPGVIRTPMLGEVPTADQSDGPDVTAMVSEMAVGRFGMPEEVGECVIWITSGRASLVTASTLAPNGGMVGA
ncbi:oxidoreductase [Thozetella sp. PMI_491]|nr:oxidoreductase [Thozetella sp. PMI_491]